MKKIIAIILVLIIALPICYVGFALPKNVIGESDVFSQTEIKDAMKTAKKYVKDFDGVLLLLKLKYSDKICDKVLESYDDVDRENTIVISVDFATKLKTTVLNPADIYVDYRVIMKRENKNSPWSVVDAGY